MSGEVVLRPGNIIDYFMFKLIDPLTYPSGKESGLNNTLRFFNKNIPNPEDFLVFLSQKDFFPLVKLAENFHKKDERHASGDPYLKHIFYTSYLSYELLKTLKYDKKQARIFIAATLFHDTIEMKRANHEKITKKDLYFKLKEKGIESKEAKKMENFCRIMYERSFLKLPKELLEMAKNINIADDVAIIREIINDVISGNDGPNIKVINHKSFADRITNYNDRIKIVADIYPNHPLLFQLREDLNYLNKLLPQ